jgi:hypothetical protein
MRNRYWSCSKFADWLRGTPKPTAETSRGWRVWTDLAKKTHPVRYWIAEEGLDLIQNTIYWPTDQLYSIKYYINNRWVTRTHALTAHPRDIKPGSWQDVGYRFLPCLFNELQDFVEVELAWWHIAWDQEARKKFRPPFYAWGWWRWRTWRCPEAGVDNLHWQMSLTNKEWCSPDHPDYDKPTPQAERAKEVLELYRWWTEVYRNRPDPHDASGWTALCEARRSNGRDFFDLDDEAEAEHQQRHAALDKCHALELQYEEEDTAMMIRLIKIRGSLWT